MSDVFADVARQALKAYSLADAPCLLLQHSENVTFKVNAGHEARLLRIHSPRSAFMGKHGADAKMVNSEMVWLEALRRETDLPVQQPIMNDQSQFVTTITQGKRKFNCTLLEWLEGEPYRRGLENEQSAAQLGALVGMLHQFSKTWQTPAGFMRPKRDVAYFRKTMETLKPATEDGRISYRDFKSLETAIDLLTQMMGLIRKKNRMEGLLHGDLHKGNFIVHQGQIRLIDFSMSATGSYLFDLGVGLSDMNLMLHPVFLEEYQKYTSLPPNYARLIEGFFLAGMVMTFSYWLELPEAQEELVHEVSLVAREYATKFNRDERFWFPV